MKRQVSLSRDAIRHFKEYVSPFPHSRDYLPAANSRVVYSGEIFYEGWMDRFEWQDYDTSGFKVREEVKYLKLIKDKNGNTFMIAAVNNNTPKLFAINE